MFYAIISVDQEDSLTKRKKVREQHITRLQDLQEQGRLLLAGPHPRIDAEDPEEAGFSGSLIVAEFESLAAANEWAEADPYVTAGVYAKVEVKPFKRVFPRG